jgi:hypothetical protein
MYPVTQQEQYADFAEKFLPEVNAALPRGTPRFHNQQQHAKQVELTAPKTAESVQRNISLDVQQKLHSTAEQSQVPADYGCGFENLLMEYPDIFRTAGNRTHTCPLFEQAIPLTDEIPVCVKEYPLPRAAREALKACISEFLEAGIIQPSNSGYNSPV